ncbi:MAG: hypothetical protein M3P45_03300 [Acidobacteriota bacterium]|nr:hypothetical protein [Acidobacteriota bacterium]
MAFLFAAACTLSVAAFQTAAARPDNPPPGDAVGVIEGEAIAVTGPMSVDTVNGQIVTMLRSGSDLRVKSGSALIKLVEGGQISICGPAHLSVLKSGTALTIALDTGTIHAHIERLPILTMYTPQIQAQPVAIGDGAQDTVVGFDSAGAMCIRTNRGALRLEQQLTGQSVLVPQGGDVFLSSGQIDSLRTSSAAGHCACELQIVVAPAPQPEISHLATAEDLRRKVKVEDVKPNVPVVEAQKPLAPKEEPIYQVFVPPLIFDAKAAVQPEVDTKMIVLIRRVRVRPTLIFQGRVEGDLVAVKEPVPAIPGQTPTSSTHTAITAPPAPTATRPAPTSPRKDESLTERVRSLVRRLWP